jgi:amino acid transporter
MATVAPLPPAAPAARAELVDKGLKSNAINYVSNVVIAVASVAPGYSLAATLGLVVAVAGLQAPAVFLVAFVPMLLVASAYKFLNKADPDCGTTFSWVARAFGPRAGWLGGWAIIVADIVVMANLAQIAGSYTFQLFSVSASTLAITAVGVVWIVLMTVICYIGIELNARTQRWLLSAEVVILALFAVWALVKAGVDHPAGHLTPSLSWFWPFDAPSLGGFLDATLLAVFIYWGWDSGVAVNEESEDASEGPGRAAVVSTILLLLIYVVVSVAAQAFSGTKPLVDHSDDVLGFLGGQVFPSPLDKLLIIAVLTSAAASTQTTILPTARTSLSMARQGALPRIFGRVHPRFQTPDVSTIVMGVASIVFYVVMTAVSTNILFDTIAALGFLIAFYYGLTGFACAWYYRHQLTRDARTFVMVGVAPVLGGLILFFLFGKAVQYYGQKANAYTHIAGVGTPVFIGVGSLLLGVVVMELTRRRVVTPFWRRRTEEADPALLS